jgi:hypothetical protein
MLHANAYGKPLAKAKGERFVNALTSSYDLLSPSHPSDSPLQKSHREVKRELRAEN